MPQVAGVCPEATARLPLCQGSGLAPQSSWKQRPHGGCPVGLSKFCCLLRWRRSMRSPSARLRQTSQFSYRPASLARHSAGRHANSAGDLCVCLPSRSRRRQRYRRFAQLSHRHSTVVRVCAPPRSRPWRSTPSSCPCELPRTGIALHHSREACSCAEHLTESRSRDSRQASRRSTRQHAASQPAIGS